jgi:HEAT repeat protein
VATTDDLLKALDSQDWATRADAATQLRTVQGETVTRALVRSLKSDDTAVTQAAVESLLERDDPKTVDLIWEALPTLNDDLADHIWLFLSMHPLHPVSIELERRYDCRA